MIFLALCCIVMTATAQQKQRAVVIPGQGSIDVERLNKQIDLNQDISRLSITELRVLRNSFWAREGYPFRDAFLRGVFQCTSWYDSLQWKRWEKLEANDQWEYSDNTPWRDTYYKMDAKMMPVRLTRQEQAFAGKLKAREELLLKENFLPQEDGQRVNISNVVNAMQLESFDNGLRRQLGREGFAIVPAQHEQLFHVYEKNDYTNFPNFVTTDLFLQLYHLYFDCLLRDVEQRRLFSVVHRFCDRGYELTQGTTAEQQWLHTYFDVARSLLSGQSAQGTAQEEVERVMKSENSFSEYLGYTDVPFGYALFRPRGHYTRNDSLQRYFRSMMWLQTVPFGTDKPQQFRTAVVLAELTGGDATMSSLYRQISEPMTWLFGTPDNMTILQLHDLLKATGLTAEKMLGNKKALKRLRQQTEEIAEQQTRIRPKFEYTSRHKLNLLPQRYMPDAEVLQEMVDYDNMPTRRALPRGLDILAAMGVTSAERILTDELKEGQRWNGFAGALSRIKQRMQEIDWQQTISNRWMDALKTVSDTCLGYPYFMLTDGWQKKELNAALASWAELKHDAILYAKQPFGAECGGGGPPEPVVKGYVEPNVKFWRKAISLLNATADVLKRYDLATDKATQTTQRLREEAEFLLRISEKELAGRRLKDEEYDQLKCIGATFENISLDLIRDPEQWLTGWSDVQGADRKVALIADVYTANADNNPEKCVMYAAVGAADEIYCVVEVEGYLWLMRGAVLSYRETQRPLDMQRLTDEEWQQQLEQTPDEGRPDWMRDIMVPLKETPKTNERYFYSTGC